NADRARLTVTDARMAPLLAAQQDQVDPIWQDYAVHPLDGAEIQARLARIGGSFGWDAVPGSHGLAHWLELPLGGPPQRAVAPQGTQAAPPFLRDLRVAVLAPEGEAREHMVKALQGADARVTAHRLGEAFIEGLRKSDTGDWPQALICDVALEDMDGYAGLANRSELETERNVTQAGRIPAIAVSRHRAEEGRLRAIMAGFQAHVPRPLDSAILLERLIAVIRRQEDAVDGRKKEAGPD